MASSVITPKKSVLSGAVPSSESLSFGEIAINHADKKLYAKHPSTGAIQEIGSLSAHSHDELYSLDKSQHIELQGNGTLVVTAGSTSKTLTLPGASGTLATLGDITAGGGGGGGVQANWDSTSGPSSILNKPTLATVATSGSYTDLSSKPTLGTAAATDATAYATAAQGTKADSASQPGHGHSLSNITVSGATNGQVPAWNGTAWVPSTPTASGMSVVQMTLAQYTALGGNVDSNTLYIIVG